MKAKALVLGVLALIQVGTAQAAHSNLERNIGCYTFIDKAEQKIYSGMLTGLRVTEDARGVITVYVDRVNIQHHSLTHVNVLEKIVNVQQVFTHFGSTYQNDDFQMAIIKEDLLIEGKPTGYFEGELMKVPNTTTYLYQNDRYCQMANFVLN